MIIRWGVRADVRNAANDSEKLSVEAPVTVDVSLSLIVGRPTLDK